MNPERPAPPEWEAVQETIARSREVQRETWEALGRSRGLAFYTDGSAPVKNPGGPTGFAAIATGVAASAGGAPGRVPPRPASAPPGVIRLDLVGRIPARPEASNNRAEIAGVLAALEALRHLVEEHGASPSRVPIWCDSEYAVKCANRLYKRHRNRDLWELYDRLARSFQNRFQVRWIRGHTGTEWNEEADRLAREAALGRGRSTGEPSPEPDYRLTLLGGAYLLETRTGRSRKGEVDPGELRHPDPVEYRTLAEALRDLGETVAGSGHEPGQFHLLVRSSRELVLQQLRGRFKVRSPILQPLHRQVVELLRPWGAVGFERVPARRLKDELWLEGPSSSSRQGRGAVREKPRPP